MKMTFERGVLGMVGVLVAGLVAVNWYYPPSRVTIAPKVSLRLPAPVAMSRDKARRMGLKTAAGIVHSPTVAKISKAFRHLEYDLAAVSKGDGRVPRLYLATMPSDLGRVRGAAQRKVLFVKSMLPLILQVNEEILRHRRRLWKLGYRLSLGERLSAIDRLWLIVMAERYGVRRGDVKALFKRVDVIPPSLALAQGAEESGWGTSRFSREGNAIFGQWTFSRIGDLTPVRRDDDKTHKVKAFRSLLESVRAYALNLNTHWAYRTYRKKRASLRARGVRLTGDALAGHMTRYSERGEDYVRTIRVIMESNGLDRLDAALLRKPPQKTKPLI